MITARKSSVNLRAVIRMRLKSGREVQLAKKNSCKVARIQIRGKLSGIMLKSKPKTKGLTMAMEKGMGKNKEKRER